ncbi:helix-turn-helix domain-containing protein [Microbacterium sp. 4R-513]|uniref:helix-turn-helix domain-containing protein n=1 Tax=Microbacterium sp. 4R-513 TaxID=2567934 RepID=UPI0019D160AB|nr:helix-turn-helix domain-containing protein [Microbacterium sp. 4R-513]
MPENPTSRTRMLAAAEAAELLGVSVDEVMELVQSAQLRGVRVGSPARWRIEAESIEHYLDDRVEEARRMALWRQSNEASFPELWGSGVIRNSD